ncbi:MAG: nitroreductase family protein [Bacteroidota bacterium]|nr:nitroreductase family protein [Bacteroidota bacterium]
MARAILHSATKASNKLIESRVSVRRYTPSRKVEKEKLLRILDAGRFAPSAANFVSEVFF